MEDCVHYLGKLEPNNKVIIKSNFNANNIEVTGCYDTLYCRYKLKPSTPSSTYRRYESTCAIRPLLINIKFLGYETYGSKNNKYRLTFQLDNISQRQLLNKINTSLCSGIETNIIKEYRYNQISNYMSQLTGLDYYTTHAHMPWFKPINTIVNNHDELSDDNPGTITVTCTDKFLKKFVVFGAEHDYTQQYKGIIPPLIPDTICSLYIELTSVFTEMTTNNHDTIHDTVYNYTPKYTCKKLIIHKLAPECSLVLHDLPPNGFLQQLDTDIAIDTLLEAETTEITNKLISTKNAKAKTKRVHKKKTTTTSKV